MPNRIPSPPYKTKMFDGFGIISKPWAKFIRQLFEKVGEDTKDSVGDVANRVSAIEQGPT